MNHDLLKQPLSAAAAERQTVMQTLLEPMLAPLERAFGPYGDLAKEAFAQAVCRASVTADE